VVVARPLPSPPSVVGSGRSSEGTSALALVIGQSGELVIDRRSELARVRTAGPHVVTVPHGDDANVLPRAAVGARGTHRTTTWRQRGQEHGGKEPETAHNSVVGSTFSCCLMVRVVPSGRTAYTLIVITEAPLCCGMGPG
jgi:hypothetical protein